MEQLGAAESPATEAHPHPDVGSDNVQTNPSPDIDSRTSTAEGIVILYLSWTVGRKYMEKCVLPFGSQAGSHLTAAGTMAKRRLRSGCLTGSSLSNTASCTRLLGSRQKISMGGCGRNLRAACQTSAMWSLMTICTTYRLQTG